MTVLELQKRKNWALEVLQSCNSEDAIVHMEALAHKLLGKNKQELKRPNCFTLEEVKEMLKETEKDAKNKIGVPHSEVQAILNKWR